MTKTLERTIAEIARLTESDQEQIGQEILSPVEKRRRLREEIDRGLRSLDAGVSQPLDVDAFLKNKNARHGTV